jgi:hypothetical protein
VNPRPNDSGTWAEFAALNFEYAAGRGRPWHFSRLCPESCQAGRPVRAVRSSSFVRTRLAANCMDDVRPAPRPIGEPRPARGLPRANPTFDPSQPHLASFSSADPRFLSWRRADRRCGRGGDSSAPEILIGAGVSFRDRLTVGILGIRSRNATRAASKVDKRIADDRAIVRFISRAFSQQNFSVPGRVGSSSLIPSSNRTGIGHRSGSATIVTTDCHNARSQCLSPVWMVSRNQNK